MNRSESITGTIERLLTFAQCHELIEAVDRPYYRNLLLDAMGEDAPQGEFSQEGDIPATATTLLNELCVQAIDKGLIEDMQYARDLFSARIMGLLTPSPKEVRSVFQHLKEEKGPEAATQYFYDMCRASDYIKVDSIAQNIRYFADSPCGQLEITINLSKPERIPRKLRSSRMRPALAIPSVCFA